MLSHPVCCQIVPLLRQKEVNVVGETLTTPNEQQGNSNDQGHVNPADYWEHISLVDGCQKSSHSVHHDEKDD